MKESVSLEITDASQVGAARRHGIQAAQALGFDETYQGKLALILTELGTNLLSHAGSGELLLRPLELDGRIGFEVLAVDTGPGMTNVTECLNDGYSTAGTPGNGLGAIQRLSTHFTVYSVPERGCVLLAQLLSTPGAPSVSWEVGVVNRAKPGQEVCGDTWVSIPLPQRSLYFLADGLGHGPEAATASQAAAQVVYKHAERSPKEILEAVHRAISGTRGVAAAVVEIQRQKGQVCFAGVGNIAGAIVSEVRSQSMVSHNGIVGHQMNKVQEFVYTWSPESLLILHSDGLGNRWRLDNYPGLRGRHPGLIAGVLYRDFQRGTDDATILVARAGEVE